MASEMDFHKISLIILGLGYEMDLLCMSSGGGFVFANDAGEAMMIIGFLCYTAAVILSLLINFADFKGNFIATVSTAVLAYVACLCIIIGLAIYGSNLRGIFKLSTYSTTVFSISLIFAFLAGLSLTLEVAGCKGSKAESTAGTA